MSTCWKPVAEVGQLEEGHAIEVVVNGEVVAVARWEHRVYAIEGMCAHQGGPLGQGQVTDGCIRCPWHGWQYDLRNGNNATTCRPMLKTYDCRERDGWIEILI